MAKEETFDYYLSVHASKKRQIHRFTFSTLHFVCLIDSLFHARNFDRNVRNRVAEMQMKKGTLVGD